MLNCPDVYDDELCGDSGIMPPGLGVAGLSE